MLYSNLDTNLYETVSKNNNFNLKTVFQKIEIFGNNTTEYFKTEPACVVRT